MDEPIPTQYLQPGIWTIVYMPNKIVVWFAEVNVFEYEYSLGCSLGNPAYGVMFKSIALAPGANSKSIDNASSRFRVFSVTG